MSFEEAEHLGDTHSEPKRRATRTGRKKKKKVGKTKTGQSPARSELKSFVCAEAAVETCPSRVTELRAALSLRALYNSQLLRTASSQSLSQCAHITRAHPKSSSTAGNRRRRQSALFLFSFLAVKMSACKERSSGPVKLPMVRGGGGRSGRCSAEREPRGTVFQPPEPRVGSGDRFACRENATAHITLGPASHVEAVREPSGRLEEERSSSSRLPSFLQGCVRRQVS